MRQRTDNNSEKTIKEIKKQDTDKDSKLRHR